MIVCACIVTFKLSFLLTSTNLNLDWAVGEQ